MRRRILLCAIGLAVCTMVAVFHFRWGNAIAQGGDTRPVFEIHEYVSYQFHVLKNPTGLLALTRRDGQFYLYIADSGNHVIRAFNTYTGLNIVAGAEGSPGYVNGDPLSARFNAPTGLTGKNGSWRECEEDPNYYRPLCWWNNYQEIYVND